MQSFLKSGFHVFVYELFTSKQFAIVILRKALLGLLKTFLGAIIFCEVLLHIPWVYDVPGVPKPDVSDPTVHVVSVAVILSLLLAMALVSYFTRIIRKHLIRRKVFAENKFFEDSTFLQETIEVRQESAEDGQRFYPVNMKLGDVHERALGYYGMTLSGELLTTVTVGVEYVFNILSKIYNMYARNGHFATRTATPKELYSFVINTSFSTWINAKTGHVEMKNQRCVYNTLDVINVKYLRVELDHDREEFVRMFIELEDGLGLREVVDDDVEGGNNNSCAEATVICMVLGALVTHPHLHFWSNGVGQLIKTKDPKAAWKLAKTSSEVTEYINASPTGGTASFMGTSKEALVNVIAWNMNQGLPLHYKDNEYIKRIGEKSMTHIIAKQARENLKALHPEWPNDVLNCLLVATVYHTADHYYPEQWISYATQSKYLKMDFSFFRTGIYSPNKYISRKLKCCQNLDDPVCKAIYDAAKNIDKGFADEIQIGIMS